MRPLLALAAVLAVSACATNSTLTPAQRAEAQSDQRSRPAPSGPMVTNPPGDLSANGLRCTMPTNQNTVVCSR